MTDTQPFFTSNAPEMARLKRYHRQPLRLFYFMLPKKLRRQRHIHADLQQQNHVAHCWQQFIHEYQKGNWPTSPLQAKQTLGDKPIIWQYWAQGTNERHRLPEVVQIGFDSIDQHANDCQIIRLNDTNVRDYLNLPDFVFAKRQNPAFRPAFFADLLRLALLHAYGGVWLDATVLLTAPLPQDWLKSDLFFFQRQNHTPEPERWHNFNSGYFSWHERHRVNLLNSILFAQKNHAQIGLLTELMLHFWRTQNHIPHYFFFQILCDVLQQTGHLKTSTADHTLAHQLSYALNRHNDPTHVWAAIDAFPIHKLTYNLDLKHVKSKLAHTITAKD